jgi:hypothetical protein
MSTLVRSLAAIAVAVSTTALPAMAAQPQKGKPFVMAESALPSKKSPASIDWSRPAPKPRLGESVKVGPQPEPPRRRPDPFTPGGKTRFIPGSPGVVSKLPGGGIAPAAKGIRESEIRERADRVIRSMISGRVTLENCVGGPSNVRIRVVGGGRTHEVTGMPVPGNDFVISYSIRGLPAGRYTLTPYLVGVRCTGVWRPASASVTIASRITNVRHNFAYAPWRPPAFERLW